jgi:hypothetical protein
MQFIEKENHQTPFSVSLFFERKVFSLKNAHSDKIISI